MDLEIINDRVSDIQQLKTIRDQCKAEAKIQSDRAADIDSEIRRIEAVLIRDFKEGKLPKSIDADRYKLTFAAGSPSVKPLITGNELDSLLAAKDASDYIEVKTSRSIAKRKVINHYKQHAGIPSDLVGIVTVEYGDPVVRITAREDQ